MPTLGTVQGGRHGSCAARRTADRLKGWQTIQQTSLTRADPVKALNEDLSREYQAIIAYVVYSQTLKGAEDMNIAGELKSTPPKS